MTTENINTEAVDFEDENVEALDTDLEDTDLEEDADTEDADDVEDEDADDPDLEESDEDLEIPEFEEFVQQVVENEVDKATGTVSDEGLKQIADEYRSLDGAKRKARARAFAERQMFAAVESGDIVLAKAYVSVGENMKSDTKKKTSKRPGRKPADNTAVFAQKSAVLDLARALAVMPDNVDEDKAREQAEKMYQDAYEATENYIAWLQFDKDERGEEPEVEPFVKQAAKLALGKAARPSASRSTASSYSGPRRSVKNHIASAFADVPVGTFLKISEIAGHTSDEYGDDHPSSGAVTSALNSKNFDLPHIEAGERDGNKGATRVA